VAEDVVERTDNELLTQARNLISEETFVSVQSFNERLRYVYSILSDLQQQKRVQGEELPLGDEDLAYAVQANYQRGDRLGARDHAILASNVGITVSKPVTHLLKKQVVIAEDTVDRESNKGDGVNQVMEGEYLRHTDKHLHYVSNIMKFVEEKPKNTSVTLLDDDDAQTIVAARPSSRL